VGTASTTELLHFRDDLRKNKIIAQKMEMSNAIDQVFWKSRWIANAG
jgi:hypothetical protein